MSDEPPASVVRLLDGAVGSVGAVELLLLLRSGTGRAHTVEELCSMLGSPTSWTESQLDALARAQLVSGGAQEGWTYAPASAPLGRAVDDLAGAWRRDSRAVSRWVFRPRPGSGRRGRR
jgi:DNA-binding IclR family transcriptional regulator